MTIKTLKAVLLAGAASALLSTAALAADPSSEEAVSPGPSYSDWDLSFGVTVTSDYVSRGVTSTDGGAAVQPEAELTLFGILYVGWWGSNVAPTFFDGAPTWENDFSVGIRPEMGPFSFDLGHVWYTYNDPTDNGSGEAYITIDWNVVDPFTIGAQYWVGTGTGAGSSYAEVNASLEFMENLTASAAVGWVIDPVEPYTTWNAGVTWNPIDPLEIDVRYHFAPSTVDGAVSKVVVSASLVTSLRKLGVFGAPPPP